MKRFIYKSDIELIKSKATKVIISSQRHVNGEVGWHQHLRAKKIGIVATSIALLYLNNHNTEDANVELSVSFNFLEKAQNEDGGWAYISNLPNSSNTESTCWALRALNLKSDEYQENIKKGIEWLYTKTDLKNTTDTGWGFISEKISRVYTTCFVLRTLRELSQQDNEYTESAFQWLINSQNEDGGWGEITGNPSNVFQTSYVITTLLQLALLEKDSRIILNGINWLRNKILENGYNSPLMVCSLEFIEETNENEKSRLSFFHYNIPHIIGAFLSADKHTDPIIFEGISMLITSNTDGYWKHPFINDDKFIPIWALSDSIESFSKFQDCYNNWKKIYYFKIWRKKIIYINKYNPIQFWDKINPSFLNYTFTLITIIFFVYQSIKAYKAMPQFIIDMIDDYINFIVSVTASLVASAIIYVINRVFNNKN